MTPSRAIGIASAALGAIDSLATVLGHVNPKVSAILAGIAIVGTAFTERIHGSPEYRRRKRLERGANRLTMSKTISTKEM